MAKPYPTEDIIKALKNVDGLVSLAAKNLGCSTDTIYKRARRVKAVQQVIDGCRAALVDEAEKALRAAVVGGEAWAVALTLKTLGKERGYIERQEIVNKSETLEVVTKVVRHAADD
jgi:hypothetical protein